MNSSINQVVAQLPDVYEAAQFNRQDLFAVLSGYTAFAGGFAGRDPASAIGAAIGVAANFATKCNTGTLQETINKTRKWLTFGQAYAALDDSSDLDFDTLDVEAVPEVMKVVFMKLVQI